MESMFRLMDRDEEVANNQCIWVKGPVILGAGPFGLARPACLREETLPFVVLERADGFACLWRKRTYVSIKLHLPKQFCQLLKINFPESFPEYPTKRPSIDYLESHISQFEISPMFNERVQTARFDETSGLWRVMTVSNTESTRTKVEYICRWLVVATGENVEKVMPEIEGLFEFTRESVSETNPMGHSEAVQRKQGPSLTQMTSYYVNWKGTRALDRVLKQEAQVCYAIAMTRQLAGLLRLKGILASHESLSIQYVINETRRLLLNQETPVGCGWDGSIPQLEMLTPLYSQNGIVLEDLVPLTYSLESTNPVFDEGVRRFTAAKIVYRYLVNYDDDATFEKALLSFLMVSPVSVVVCSYESFWGIVGSEIYYPTETDLSNTSGYYHAMLLTGAGRRAVRAFLVARGEA